MCSCPVSAVCHAGGQLLLAAERVGATISYHTSLCEQQMMRVGARQTGAQPAPSSEHMMQVGRQNSLASLASHPC
jgi:hypothetical protein